MSELDLLFIAYLTRSKFTKTDLAQHIGVSRRHMYVMWKRGVATWSWADVLAIAKKLRIPVEALREQVKW